MKWAGSAQKAQSRRTVHCIFTCSHLMTGGAVCIVVCGVTVVAGGAAQVGKYGGAVYGVATGAAAKGQSAELVRRNLVASTMSSIG